MQAVYRAVGYLPSELVDLPFDHVAGVVPNEAGRVLDLDGAAVPGTYVTGWIKRGPVGLIGHTKSDAAETVASLLADLDAAAARRGPPTRTRSSPTSPSAGSTVTTWDGWERLDAHEVALGEAAGRERIKVVPREEMLRIASE